MITKPIKRKKSVDINKMYDADYYKIRYKYKNDYNKIDFTQRVLCTDNIPEKKKN